MLTGKYLDGIPTGSRAEDEALGQWIKPRMSEEHTARVRKLKELSDGMGIPLSNLAIAWCLDRPEVTSSIVGATNADQLRENVKASEVVLDEDVRDRISAILGG